MVENEELLDREKKYEVLSCRSCLSLFHNKIRDQKNVWDCNTSYEITVVQNWNQIHKALLLCTHVRRIHSIYKEHTKAIHQTTEVAVIQRNLFMIFILMLFFCRKTAWKVLPEIRTTFSKTAKITKNNYYIKITITGCSAKICLNLLCFIKRFVKSLGFHSLLIRNLTL